MFRTKQRCFAQPPFVFTFIFLLAPVSRAESITLELRTPTVYPCEPLIFDIILRLDQPVVESDDPVQQRENALRLRRRYRGELSSEDEVRAVVDVFGAPSYPELTDARTELRGTYWGFVTRKDAQTGEDDFYAEPGQYSLVVRDRHNPGVQRAHPVDVTILQASGVDQAARRVFEKPGLPYVARMIVDGRMDGETVAAMKTVANDFPDSVYARYARASLAWFERRQAKGRVDPGAAPESWARIADKMEEACTELPDWHPLRVRMLLDVGVVQFRAGRAGQARKTIEDLRDKYPRSEELQRQTDTLLEEFRKIEREAGEKTDGRGD